jgi:hypothetical protein
MPWISMAGPTHVQFGEEPSGAEIVIWKKP